MPIFNDGSGPYANRRLEAARTLGGQIQSLTFIERAAPREKFDPPESPIGLLLNSATNSLLLAGNTKRFVPRFQIGSRSGREYQQQIAIAGGQGELSLVYNPTLPLHRELTDPPLDAQYHITSIMAPPYMCASVGVYDHAGSGVTALQPEAQTIMPVNMLDQYGAVPIPQALYEYSGVNTVAADDINYEFTPVRGLPDGHNGKLVVGIDDDGSELTWTDSNAWVAVFGLGSSPSGVFALSLPQATALPDLSAADNRGHNLMAVLHVPGEMGGYLVSDNMKAFNLSISSGITIGTDEKLATRIVGLKAPAMYLGIYALATDNLLYR